MPDINQFEVEFPSTPSAVRELMSDVKGRLAPLTLDDAKTGTVELVLAEVLNNIVEHAYPDANAPGLIKLTCHSSSERLRFQIEDAGLPMPGLALPKGELPDIGVDTDELPEGGFGWFLIKDLSDELTYVRADGRNHLSVALALT